MKILIAHNRYQQLGGEDHVVQAEAEMLRSRGHSVQLLTFSNDHIDGPAAQAVAAFNSMFSLTSYRRVASTISSMRPDVLHVHNFAPTLSPSVFFAGCRGRVPIVQTLHNYRLLCAGAMLYRDGRTCERCLEKNSILPGIANGCYRGSRLGSAVVGASTALHTALGTWQRRIDRYIALTRFAADKLGRHRLPPDRIRIKPNFVPDRGVGDGAEGFGLFVGRLSDEKGVATLLAADAAHRLALPVLVAGDGPLRPQVEAACARPGSRLIALGRQSSHQVLGLMKSAAVLLIPSSCYEGFPVVIAEALSVGLPVIASRIGGLPEILSDQGCGLLHTAGDPRSLAYTLSQFASLSPEQVTLMRTRSRERYSTHFSEAVNYGQLMEIYAGAITSAAPEQTGTAASPAFNHALNHGEEVNA